MNVYGWTTLKVADMYWDKSHIALRTEYEPADVHGADGPLPVGRDEETVSLSDGERTPTVRRWHIGNLDS